LATIRLRKVEVQDMPVRRNHFISIVDGLHPSNFKATSF
jgi:hypothetical protein